MSPISFAHSGIRSVAGFTANAVRFDGATVMERSSAFTGLSTDTKTLTVSVFIKMGGTDGADQELCAFQNSQLSFMVSRLTTNGFRFQGFNAANTKIMQVDSTLTDFTNTSPWRWLGFSCDLAATTVFLFDGDTDVSTNVIATNDLMAFGTQATLNEFPSQFRLAVNPMTADIAEFYLDTSFTNFTNVANRRIFKTAAGHPAQDLTSRGAPIYLTGPTATWQNNIGGTGGTWPVFTGTITTAPTAP